MSKAWRKDQDRNGSARRRRLEYDAVMRQIERRKDAFAARLKRNLEPRGSCLCWTGTTDHKGYARLNLSIPHVWNGVKRKIITIHAHRMFLIMKLQRPIRRGYEAGHLPECQHRTCVAHLREEHYKSNANTASS